MGFSDWRLQVACRSLDNARSVASILTSSHRMVALSMTTVQMFIWIPAWSLTSLIFGKHNLIWGLPIPQSIDWFSRYKKQVHAVTTCIMTGFMEWKSKDHFSRVYLLYISTEDPYGENCQLKLYVGKNVTINTDNFWSHLLCLCFLLVLIMRVVTKNRPNLYCS